MRMVGLRPNSVSCQVQERRGFRRRRRRVVQQVAAQVGHVCRQFRHLIDHRAELLRHEPGPRVVPINREPIVAPFEVPVDVEQGELLHDTVDRREDSRGLPVHLRPESLNGFRVEFHDAVSNPAGPQILHVFFPKMQVGEVLEFRGRS